MVSKAVVDYLERIKRLYVLIKQERTGSLNDIARKMLLSRRTITNYISELKSLGADIRFDVRSKIIYVVHKNNKRGQRYCPGSYIVLQY